MLYTEQNTHEQPSSMKVVTRLRYPKQIAFSGKFIQQLKSEYERLKSNNEQITEIPNKIPNYKDKFIKAINFHLSRF
jgi:hypothetical protein